MNYIFDGLYRGFHGLGAIFCDFSKAFDFVNHSILIEKLNIYGIRGRQLEFFRNYLENRKQYVQVNEGISPMATVRHEVPQGSVTSIA